MKRTTWVVYAWFAVATSVICIFLFMWIRHIEAAANAKNSSHQLYQLVALTALGHTSKINPYGISSGGYGFLRCDFWKGESCSGIIANRSLFESARDLALVVDAIEEPCKYLNPQLKESDRKSAVNEGQSMSEMNRKISVARSFAFCERNESNANKSKRAPHKIDRVFVSFYEGAMREYRADKVQLILEIKLNDKP